MAYNNNDLYNIILFFLRKDRRGGVYRELEHQQELQRMNIEYLESILPKYEADQDVTDKLAIFKKVVQGVSLTVAGNRITIPTDYIRHGYLRYRQNGDESRDIDVLTDGQWSYRLGSTLIAPTERNPVCIYRGGFIDFKPDTLNQNYLEYSYLGEPIIPFFDGYYDANGNFIYMEEGASNHTLLADEVGLDGQTVGAYVTKSIELEWHDDDKLVIADRILRRLGVVINEPLITQYNDAILKEK